MLVGLALAACAGAPAAPETAPAPAELPPRSNASGLAVVEERGAVERLLDASDVDAVLGARARSFTRQVALLAGDLTDAELERLVPAVREGFDARLLREDVAAFLEGEAPPGRIEEVLEWLEGGRSAEAHAIVDAYAPPLELREWLAEHTTDPPSAIRIRQVARWTEARGTGDFFLLVEQALAEAAFSVRRVFRPDARAFRALEGEELLDRLEASFNAAVVAELHRSETVPDSVIAGSTREFESEAGVWYVRSYQLAVAEAIRAAGLRVVDALAR